uniref:Uncharacterized protein n=1 Tax=Oryza brachyantha TaxID=4533 RepID=J3LCD8_ORYBR
LGERAERRWTGGLAKKEKVIFSWDPSEAICTVEGGASSYVASPFFFFARTTP